jgi:succinyl-diaminopimelate desuccinylase
VTAIDRAALVAFTQELVRIESVNDPERGRSEAPAAELVERQMRAFGWEPAVEEVAPGRPNVVAVVEGGAPGPTLLFEGHTDVVTAGARELWSVDPFGGEIRDGRLYGRGAADMKAGVAAMLFAAAAVERSGPFPGRIVVAALADEEGMMLGAKRFCTGATAAGVDAAIVCEPEGWEVCTAQKGALRLRLDARGKMAHGAMPQHGVNPAPALAAFVEAVRAHERRLQAACGEHPTLGAVYLTPTVIRAGDELQLNVIPELAWLAVDVRTIPGVDHADLVARLRADAARIETETGVRLELSVVDDRPSTETAADEAVVQAVVAAHRARFGEDPALGGVPGATDGTILWRDLGIPVVVYGPGGKWIAHQVDEYVEVDEIGAYAEVYADAARRYLGNGRPDGEAPGNGDGA